MLLLHWLLWLLLLPSFRTCRDRGLSWLHLSLVERVPYPCRVIRRLWGHVLAENLPTAWLGWPHTYLHASRTNIMALFAFQVLRLQMVAVYRWHRRTWSLTSSSPIIRHFLPTRNSTAWEGHVSLSSFRPLSDLVTYSHAARLPFISVSIYSLSISLVFSCFGLYVCNLIGGKYSFLLLAHSQCYLPSFGITSFICLFLDKCG